MLLQKLTDQWNTFLELAEKLPQTNDENMNVLITRYIEQNMTLLNEVFATTITNLEALKSAQTANDVICLHAKYTNDVSKRLSLSAHRFMNAQLGDLVDYNEWLKLHCDFATD